MQSFYCQVCGQYVQGRESFRPVYYCSDNCRNYNKYKNALEKSLNALHPTSEARKLIRGDMFRLANLLSNGTNKPGQ